MQRIACLGITGAICTTPTDAKEALTDLPPLDLVIQGEAWSAAHCLWSVGCWSYLHPNQRHSILTRLQKSDPVFTIGVKVMRPAFNLEPKYRVTILTREECTTGPGTPPVVKGLVWFQVGPRQRKGLGWGLWAILTKKLSIRLGKHATVFQAEVDMQYKPVFMKLKLRVAGEVCQYLL